MARIVWSPHAVADLEAICQFIASDLPAYARVLAAKVMALVSQLPQNPRSGRIVPELKDPDVRERILGNYRIIYRLREQVVQIVAIVHGARLLNRRQLGPS
jgi:toxin ParE1/3/4